MNLGLPIPASTYADQIDFGIRLIHWAMFAIFILWGIFFTYLLVRYRRKDGVAAERDAEHGSPLKALLPDFIVMAFEIALIVFYAIPVWNSIKINMPKGEAANKVDVVAEQFAWNVIYPGPDGKFGKRDPNLIHFTNPVGIDYSDPASADDVVLANELHMPLEKPTLIRLMSKDVIHSFFVPEFRIKQDAVPGMEIPVWVEPTKTGTFEISCAQLCGFAHSLMRGDVMVHEPAEFDTWLKEQSANVAAAAPAAKSSKDDF
jgi:cytochrome c oxidase subunit II